MTNKTQVEGAKIMDRMLTLDDNLGGIFTLTLGAPGSKKTSVLLNLMAALMEKYPEVPIVFNQMFDVPMMEYRITKTPVHHIKDGARVEFQDRNKENKVIQLPDTFWFKDYADAVDHLQLGRVNTMWFQNRREMCAFISYLSTLQKWCFIFVDELHELASPGSGEDFKSNKMFANICTNVRKTKLCLHTNTQNQADIFYSVRNKVQCFFLMPGSRADGKRHRVRQEAIDSLHYQDNKYVECYVALTNSNFGKVRFTKVFKPDEKHVYAAHVRF